MSSRYSPFPNKKITQISSSDLESLKSVSEGWYVEYKRVLPNSKSIAKSISAFANTYGGWLFIGVQESGKSDNFAESAPGIPETEVDAALQTIRNSVSTQLNPTPFFEYQILKGPNDAMGLSEARCVICIEINQSNLAPHVHSSGVIYRRVSDCSDPRAETDRHQLEILWSRQKGIHKDYKRWIERKPEQVGGDDHGPYLRLLLEADIYGAKGQFWNFSVRELKEIFKVKDGKLSIPFDSFYHSGFGIIARQTSSLSRHSDFGLTWIVGKRARCEIWLPITKVLVEDPSQAPEHFDNYEHSRRFFEKLTSEKARGAKVLDLNQIFVVLSACASIYMDLLEKAGFETKSVHSKAILYGVGGGVPFFDSKIILDRIDECGLPVCLHSESMVPSGLDANGFLEVKIVESEDATDLRGLSLSVFWLELVCRALGLEGVVADDALAEAHPLAVELSSGWRRSNVYK